jgi:hypothetical protein
VGDKSEDYFAKFETRSSDRTAILRKKRDGKPYFASLRMTVAFLGEQLEGSVFSISWPI